MYFGEKMPTKNINISNALIVGIFLIRRSVEYFFSPDRFKLFGMTIDLTVIPLFNRTKIFILIEMCNSFSYRFYLVDLYNYSHFAFCL